MGAPSHLKISYSNNSTIGGSGARKVYARAYVAAVVAAVVLRIVIVVIPGNSVRTPWSGGGDMEAYILLARNLVAGDGYSYAHVPSAFRPPGYPGVLAGMRVAFGEHFVFAVRCLQAIAGFAAAYFAMRAARLWFDERAGRAALLASLWFPSLVYFSGEILSEALTSFFVALFLWALAEDFERPRGTTAAAMGLILGAGALFRPNVAALGVIAITAAWLARKQTARTVSRPWQQLALVPVCVGLMVGPWIVRNWEVFHKVMYSTQGSCNALSALINPEARLMSGEGERMRAAIGVILPKELETNARSRLKLGSETELNQRCWVATRRLWASMGWTIVPWALEKCGTFWLSTDQLLRPESSSTRSRILHAGGVSLYWLLLLLALRGWWRVKDTRPTVAAILFGYAILVTLMHTPFVMNSRIRTPLVDPLIAVLAGGGAVAMRWPRWSDRLFGGPGH